MPPTAKETMMALFGIAILWAVYPIVLYASMLELQVFYP